jgi:hypothetical protein
LSKTFEGVVLEIRSGGTVFRILIAADATGFGLALSSCAGEKMGRASIMSLNENVFFEESVYWRPPRSFEGIYKYDYENNTR